jgi:serine phosphatase RsbU (regulator of sigma subunit)
LHCASANNPIWVIRHDSKESDSGKKLIELATDRMPVGRHTNDKTPFQEFSFSLTPGDMLYAFTDGMQDQFGGPKNKKFNYRQFAALLMRISELKVSEQKQEIDKIFSAWKGNDEQTDDVCIIGIRI